MPQKIVFSSDDLPSHLNDRARLSAWHESCGAISSCEASYLSDRPFFMHLVGCIHASSGVKVIQWDGTLAHTHRAPRHIARDGVDDLALSFNVGAHPWMIFQRGQQTVASSGSAILHSQGETSDFRVKAPTGAVAVLVPRAELAALVPNAEDLVGQLFDHNTPAIRHLQRYLELILGPDGIGTDPALDAHFGQTLVDLVALALGAGRDVAEIARMRGLRAARLQAVVRKIKESFADPACSPQRVALMLGLSARYVQDLLQETGATFTERVLELRLQQARSLLTSAQGDGLRIAEIASRCGFNDVSYFNRRFRARFGAAPTQFRGRHDDTAG
jgi:AraC-like DNA-binding protein